MDDYFSRSITGPPFERDEEKKYEFCRYGSFKDWPSASPIFPSGLAKVGFFSTGNGDEVACYVCGAKKDNWKEEDNPEIIHRELNAECPFFTQDFEDNVPINASAITGNELSNDQRLCDLERLLDCESAADSSVRDGASNGSNEEEPNLNTNENLSPTGTAGNFSGTSTDVTRSGHSSGLPGNSQSRMRTSVSSGSITSQARSAAANVVDAERDNSGNRKVRRTQSQGQDIPPPTGAAIGPLRFERNRLATFKKWPSAAKVSAADLAKSGFTYTGSGDRVQCVFCKGILRNWEEGDRPHIEHRKHFPRCPLILGMEKGNVPLAPGQTSCRQSSGTGTQSGSHLILNQNVAEGGTNMALLGVTTDRPKHVQFAVEAQRVGSFQNWPSYKHQTPQQLAEAGFFYAGFNDNVKCFYCNGGLRNWEKGDDPWHEHARWFPTCPYVLNVKGQDYVNTVKAENREDAPILTQSRRSAEGSTIAELPVRHEVEEREVKARMDRPYVKVVEEMGIKRDLIMAVIRKRLMETGEDFSSATALLEAVFNMDEDQERCEESVEQQPEQNNNSADSIEVESGGEKEGDKPKDVDLLKENTELKEQRLCKICMVSDANMVFLPCGHLVSCASCSPALHLCPICRAVIKGSVRTYIS